MKQPSQSAASHVADAGDDRHQQKPPPMWLRPAGVASGTWHYVHQWSIADRYDAFVEDTRLCKFDANLLECILPPLSRPRTQCVLDLGCGTGRSTIPLAARGYEVIAIDLSQPMLRVLQQKSDAVSVCGRIYPLKANLVQLDALVDGSADHAICMFATMGMIQGRANRHDMLRHARRIVRPGGTLTVHVHNRWAAMRERGGLKHLARSWLCSRQNGNDEFGDTTYAYRGLKDMFMHRFSRRELVTDLEANGWRVDQLIRLSIDGGSILKRAGIAGGFIVVATNAR